MAFKKIILLLTIQGLFFYLWLAVAQADTANVVPDAKHANDNTGEAISEIISDNSVVNPDTLSAVAASDGTYTEVASDLR
ncbi:MAG: hypothetical protein A2745_01255 [Candidatus Harrisonbacteria bacterium RIFCSPHIGHO2_01_FULL_44_13]|uniref:Uncharacterized protein n=1 Tax=Candidatus Harrisonbacteria bacterium RIFCSPLOWO2_01_FULL_44_18 TaxID=1798407 RepID=A0A1G1ZLJ7_9BACT|nr:MAG: hypothetical protein A2745_01255 [Candidatus Harrisonbacteria bacterium RIFCSPHIGHO2_01_FULL_44_13]OGY65424.1 MAG: hypothetical protein A3A16_03165 [Candidatus Harrisonbacteria bacterium RIFCSPLOWO2_01_FULL_44_18]